MVRVYGDSWHPGVVGIVASRLTRHFHRPCLVLGREGTVAKGSGRSVGGINLIEVLGQCSDLLTDWGGHPMAVGVALPVENVPDFQGAVRSRQVREHGEGREEEPILEVASWLDPTAVNDGAS